MATRSVLSRAATDDTQKGCSRPGSPRSPWASRCRASGRFLERPHKATELGTGSRVSEGAGVRAERPPGGKGSSVHQLWVQTRSAKLSALCPHLCQEVTTVPAQEGPHQGRPGAVAAVGDIRRAAYPSSAPDTMCSSLMSWMLSMEPLQKGGVRGRTQPHPAHGAPTWRSCHLLTGGRRRPAGTPQGSSTHAQSRPGPQLSRSTPCPEHPVLPRRLGVRSWRGDRGKLGSHVASHTHTCTPSPHTLTASPRRSSPPHSTPSQSGRGTCCRAGGCLCGTPAPKDAQGEDRGGLEYSRRDRRQAPGLPQSQVPWHRKPASRERSVDTSMQHTWSQGHAHLPWSRCGPLRLSPPSSSLSLYPIQVLYRAAHHSKAPGGSLKTGTLCLFHPIPQAQHQAWPTQVLDNVCLRKPSSSPTRRPGVL